MEHTMDEVECNSDKDVEQRKYVLEGILEEIEHSWTGRLVMNREDFDLNHLVKVMREDLTREIREELQHKVHAYLERESGTENVDGVVENIANDKEYQPDDLSAEDLSEESGGDTSDEGDQRASRTENHGENDDISIEETNIDQKMGDSKYQNHDVNCYKDDTLQPDRMSEGRAYYLLQEIETMMYNLREDLTSEINARISNFKDSEKSSALPYPRQRNEGGWLHENINIKQPTAPPIPRIHIQDSCKAASNSAQPRGKRFPMKPFWGYILYPLIVVTVLLFLGVVAYLLTRPEPVTPPTTTTPALPLTENARWKPNDEGYMNYPGVDPGERPRYMSFTKPTRRGLILPTVRSRIPPERIIRPPPTMHHRGKNIPHPLMRGDFRPTTSVRPFVLTTRQNRRISTTDHPRYFRHGVQIKMRSLKPTTAKVLLYSTPRPYRLRHKSRW